MNPGMGWKQKTKKVVAGSNEMKRVGKVELKQHVPAVNRCESHGGSKFYEIPCDFEG
jgi:hypothetical protein